MPTFEETIKSMNKLSPIEREAKIKELNKQCICARCPTYIGKGEKRLTFCMSGKSVIIKKENGCICPACPLQKNLGLRWVYYCTRGSGKGQADL